MSEITILYYYFDDKGRRIYTPSAFVAHIRAKHWGSKIYREVL